MTAPPAAAHPVPRASPARVSRVLALLLCVLGTGCAVVDFEQRRWIFQPTDKTWAPGLAATAGMDDVWIEHVSAHAPDRGEAVRLHALWLGQTDPAAPVLLFLHGVRWDVHASAPRMRQLHAQGFSVLAVDYRGFGRSTDTMPSETLVAEDARAAWDWLARAHPQARRFIYGHSLGAAIAVRLAHEVPDEAGLVLDGAFTSLPDVFHSWRWGWLPIGWMITQRFDAAARIAQVGSPVLVVHARDDTMVTPRLGSALYERALPPKRFVLIDGAVHEDTGVVGAAAISRALRELFGSDGWPAAPATAPATMPASAPTAAPAPQPPRPAPHTPSPTTARG